MYIWEIKYVLTQSSYNSLIRSETRYSRKQTTLQQAAGPCALKSHIIKRILRSIIFRYQLWNSFRNLYKAR